jgi:hypothetical protein
MAIGCVQTTPKRTSSWLIVVKRNKNERKVHLERKRERRETEREREREVKDK